MCLLSTISHWNFNVFTLDKLTNGRPLFHAGMQLLQDHGIIDTFRLDVVKLMRCISLIEEGYRSSNPYHNAVHAVDVAQAMHCYINEYKVSQYMTPLEKLIAIFAALAHDVEHPGVNNAFLIATSNHLAALYDNVSVLEFHHWRTAMSIFRECGVFDHLDKETLDAIEWQMKSLILATDITRQQEFLTRFKDLLNNGSLNMKLEADRHFMLQIALKCADISNPGRPWEVSKKWSELVCDEFFKQGDCERKLGLPVSNLNDRYSTTVAKIQTGFMQFVVTPLFNEWMRFNPSTLSQTMLHNIQTNKAEWEAIIIQTKELELQELSDENMILEESEEDVVEDDDDGDVEEVGSLGEASASVASSVSPVAEASAYQPVAHEVINKVIHFDQGHRLSIPHSSDGESVCDDDEDDDTSGDDSDSLQHQSDGDDHDSNHIVSLMVRRHSLPVTSLNPERLRRPLGSSGSFSSPTQFQLRAQRRHSLPAPNFPSVGIDIFNELSKQLDTVAECSFNEEESEHYGDKISLRSLNPGALPDANREAIKLTSAHGLDSPEAVAVAPLQQQLEQLSKQQRLALNYNEPATQSPDIIAQAPSQHTKHISASNSNSSTTHAASFVGNRRGSKECASSSSLSKLAPMSNWTVITNINNKKLQRLLGNPQHSVLIGRERRAVSIPTHSRLKSILLELDSFSNVSRRVSMGDQPIYLDSTPLLSSHTSGDD